MRVVEELQSRMHQLETHTDLQHAADQSAQRTRQLTGMAVYLLTGLLGWLVSPVLGLVGIGVMIAYHALTIEGVRRGRPRRRKPA